MKLDRFLHKNFSSSVCFFKTGGVYLAQVRFEDVRQHQAPVDDKSFSEVEK